MMDLVGLALCRVFRRRRGSKRTSVVSVSVCRRFRGLYELKILSLISVSAELPAVDGL